MIVAVACALVLLRAAPTAATKVSSDIAAAEKLLLVDETIALEDNIDPELVELAADVTKMNPAMSAEEAQKLDSMFAEEQSQLTADATLYDEPKFSSDALSSKLDPKRWVAEHCGAGFIDALAEARKSYDDVTSHGPLRHERKVAVLLGNPFGSGLGDNLCSVITGFLEFALYRKFATLIQLRNIRTKLSYLEGIEILFENDEGYGRLKDRFQRFEEENIQLYLNDHPGVTPEGARRQFESHLRSMSSPSGISTNDDSDSLTFQTKELNLGALPPGGLGLQFNFNRDRSLSGTYYEKISTLLNYGNRGGFQKRHGRTWSHGIDERTAFYQSLGLYKENPIGCILNSLFVLKANTLHEFIARDLLENLYNPKIKVITIHIRSAVELRTLKVPIGADAGFSYSHPTLMVAESFLHVFMCAKRMESWIPLEKGESIKWFVNTDSYQLQESIRATYGNKVLVHNGKPTHTGHRSSVKNNGTLSAAELFKLQEQSQAETLTDWYLMGMADYFLLGAFSSFGRSAAFRTATRKSIISLSKGNFKSFPKALQRALASEYEAAKDGIRKVSEEVVRQAGKIFSEEACSNSSRLDPYKLYSRF
jgi:hypothetical protein